jgi:hypothetical protein
VLVVQINIVRVEHLERVCKLAEDVRRLGVGFRGIATRSDVKGADFGGEEYLGTTASIFEPFA